MTRTNTGFTDQNGRDIYVGDVISLSFSYGHERDSSGDIDGDFVVVLRHDGPYLKRVYTDEYELNEQSLELWSGPDSYMAKGMEDSNPYGLRDYRFKIIGNIVDNPELLDD